MLMIEKLNKKLNKKLKSKFASKKVIAFIFLALVFIAFSHYFYAPMRNNGDYGRIGFQVFVLPNSWNSSFLCMPFGTVKFAEWMPLSTGAIYGSLIAFISMGLGASCFSIHFYSLGLSVVYFLGVYQGYQQISRERTALIVVMVYLVFYLIFSYVFQSFYEEALVLALSPWLLYTYLVLLNQKHYLPFAIVGCLLVFCKAQMIFILPIVILPFFVEWTNSFKTKYLAAKVLALIFLVLASATVSFKKNDIHGFSIMNAHDRLFNGVGWVLQGVTSWPGSEFNQRLAYFQENRVTLQERSKEYEPIAQMKLMGTAYWPHGWDLQSAPFQKKLAVSPMTRYYTNFFMNHPLLIPKILGTISVITFQSDYGIVDIKLYQDQNIGVLFVAKIMNRLFQYFGAIFILLGIIGFITLKPLWQKMSVTYFTFGAPLFVVAGSGFAYFEQHMLPYFMLMPVLASLILLKEASQLRDHAKAPMKGVKLSSVQLDLPKKVSYLPAKIHPGLMKWGIGILICTLMGLMSWIIVAKDQPKAGVGVPIQFSPGALGLSYLNSSESLMGSGWGNPESWGVWLVGNDAQLLVPLPNNPTPRFIKLELRAFVGSFHPTQSVTVLLNDKPWKTVQLNQDQKNEVLIPIANSLTWGELLLNKKLRIEFQCDKPISPKLVGLGNDDRLLCLGLEKIQFINDF